MQKNNLLKCVRNDAFSIIIMLIVRYFFRLILNVLFWELKEMVYINICQYANGLSKHLIYLIRRRTLQMRVNNHLSFICLQVKKYIKYQQLYCIRFKREQKTGQNTIKM